MPEQVPEPEQLMVSQISPLLCTHASIKPSAPAPAHKNGHTAFKQITVHMGDAAGPGNLAKVLSRPPTTGCSDAPSLAPANVRVVTYGGVSAPSEGRISRN
jgi:hypothetical protein